MAVLRLSLEIDSDVYPELYAKLASLGRVGAREEKLRQLAALGLVWELARLHGPGLWDTSAGIAPDEAAAEESPLVLHDDIDLDLGFDPLAAPRELPVLLDVVAPLDVGAADDRSAAVPPANDESAAPRLKSTRSARLARMKERGLFQNG